MGMKKGLFLAVSVALIVSLMLIAMSYWSSSDRIRTGKEPEKFGAVSIRAVSESVSEENIEKVASTLGRNSVYYLDWHVRHSGVYSKNLEKDLADMIMLGRCRPIDLDGNGEGDIKRSEFLGFAGSCIGKTSQAECREFDINGDGQVDSGDADCFDKEGKSADSFASLDESLGRAASERGFSLSLKLGDVRLRQEGPWNILLDFEFRVSIADSNGRSGIDRTSRIRTLIPIEGFEDPLVAVESTKTGSYVKPGLTRTIAASAYSFPKDITMPGDFVRGKGWAYGELSFPNEGKADKRHVLYVKDSVDRVASIAESYAGVISEFPPEVRVSVERSINYSSGCMVPCDYILYEEVSNCLDCMRWSSDYCLQDNSYPGYSGACPKPSPPGILELTGRNRIGVPFIEGVSFSKAKSVLIASLTNDSLTSFNMTENTTDSKIWDIESLRSLSLCGGYVQNPDAPDFLQRLSGKTDAQSENGIETVLEPDVALGQGHQAKGNPLSLIDHEYYSGTNGIPVMGMPGCRSEFESRKRWPVVFALDSKHLAFYGVENLTCGTGELPC